MAAPNYTDIRGKIYVIALLIGMICWVAAFGATRDLYRMGQYVGVLPNFEIKSRIASILRSDPLE